MISLAYYLRVVAAMWMRPDAEAAPGGEPAIAGAAPEADPIDPDAGRRLYLLGPAVLCAAATVFFGIIPQPLVDFAAHAGAASSAQRLGCAMGVLLTAAAIVASTGVGVWAELRWPHGAAAAARRRCW